MKETDKAVDAAFYKKAVEEVKKVVRSCKDTYGSVINRIWRDSAAKSGFREVLDSEEGYLLNPWG